MHKCRFFWIAVFAIMTLTACSKNDPALPDNVVNFQSSSLGFGTDESYKDIIFTLSRTSSEATTIQIQLTDSLVAYGSQYTTSPTATNNIVNLTIPAGAISDTLKVIKNSGILLNGDEKIKFAILSSSSTQVKVGTSSNSELTFSSIISDGAQMTLNGGDGGSNAENSVFVDFSANEQTDVKRDSWDLGFYSGSDYRVILNYTLANAMAVAIDKNDLTQVTAADTVGMVLQNTYNPTDLAKVDDPVTGDLSNTAIAAIAENDADNKVYILNRGALSSANYGSTTTYKWVKIRIIRKNGGYQLQYANISDASYQTVDIPKDETHQFSYVSLDNGSFVSVAPAKGRWDIEWGVMSYYTAYGTSNIYYPYSDFVMSNVRDGVQTAEVLTSTVSYDNYGESNIASTEFKTNRDVIAGNWRATTGTIGVKTDRFYVIKDPSGNVYKLKFLNFTSQDGGTRGKPNIEYKLVKKG